MIKIKLLLLLSLCLVSLDISSQEHLSETQTNEFRKKVKQKIEEFQHTISIIVNNENTHEVRKSHVSNLLKLFIGEGEPYDYYDEEADRQVHSTGVNIHTSSIYKTNLQTQKLKNYIYKLYNPETGISKLAYTKIEIESASAVMVDNIEKVGDHYECVAYFSQKFIGYKDGKVWYSDVTSKKIRCYINHIVLPTGKRIFDAILGDIYCTKKIVYEIVCNYCPICLFNTGNWAKSFTRPDH